MVHVSKMIIILFLLFLLFPERKVSASPGEFKTNDYPIILIHGVGGWGKEEVSNFYYWGGIHDIENYLNTQGFETYTAAVGPVSSNWDRAAELFAYIKGGAVDYGAAHSLQHHHLRFGKKYSGVKTDWNAVNRVHLLGHSMGGQTSRMLLELLKSGSKEEKDFHKNNPDAEQMSSLYDGGKDWVHSITTLATPHDGSPFANKLENFMPFLKGFVYKYINLADLHSNESFNYDFKLDHWGLKREGNEPVYSYVERMFNSPFWKTKDTSQYDLSIEGAKELNEKMKTYSDVYYFSYTGDATFHSPLTGYNVPLPSMNPLLYPSGFYIGRYENNQLGSSWWPNDGLVSVPSSQYPNGHKAQPAQSTSEKGVWNYHKTQYRWDHADFIGLSLYDTVGLSDIRAFYREISVELASLPSLD
ncbi:esterase/lipase family protein [Rossellomorea sp. NPDC077527]|uniref:esterase/lipase family protein n=1 Tax=Rossellomorea sp. NPDC077527 TaxID=3364510 RepID=UPI0037C5497F